MPYIGTSPSNGVRRVHTYTATASQTTFSGASSEGITLSYVDANYLDVFQNGVLLGSADYTSTSGTSVVLAQGASADDLIVIVVYDVFSVADTVSKTNGGSFDSGVTMSSTLSVTGALSAKGGAVFNEDSADVDFRVESNGNANMLFVDGGNDKVGIGVVPTARLSLPAQASGDSGVARVAIESAVDSNDFTIAQYEDTNGTYTQIGQNVSLNSGGSTTVLDSSHKTASILFDGRGNGALMFQTGGDNTSAERLRIDSAGNTIHGATSTIGDSNANFHIAGNSNDGNETVLYLRNHNTPSGKYHKVGPTNNQGFIIYNQDNVGQYQSVGGTSWNSSSDERLKTDLTPIENGLQKVSTLRAVTGRFITDEEDVSRSFLIAQDVQAVLPEAVDVQDDEQGTLGLAYTEVIPLLVASIKELKTELDNAKARITALENAE